MGAEFTENKTWNQRKIGRLSSTNPPFPPFFLSFIECKVKQPDEDELTKVPPRRLVHRDVGFEFHGAFNSDF